MDMGHFFFTQPNPTDRISTWTHRINPPTQQPSKLQHRYSDSTWYIAICNFQPEIAYFQSFGGIIINSHKHTHMRPFNHPLSRTTRVSRYQKGKTNLDVTEARDSEWQWHPLGHMQVCTSLQTDKIAPCYGQICAPCNTWFLAPNWGHIPDRILTGSAVLAQLTAVTNRHWPQSILQCDAV